ncbi:MAG TPA: threo-3-hydroxy-L-aspartate ammonia-lyase [Candidatus Baltobacteraceae bacterium]|nr:threo-3-hydroxy-L-aspartate ammonia-lyase [Candidatus Baltobacteraceae bacterium]
MDTRRTTEIVRAGDVRAAGARLHGVVHRTPVVHSRTLDELTGAQVFLKCENFQRMGAFKFRGAYNRIVQFDAAQRRGGVVAFSSGNHAQGVALACKLLDVPAAIVMPSDAPRSKVEATKGYGAEVIFYDRHRSHRAEIAEALCRERGAVLVPPFDDPHIIAGAGTAGLELVDEIRDLDAIAAPVGGGGLLSGCCIAAHDADARIAMYGVEPEAGNDVQRSLAAGKIVHTEVPRTIADGLQTQAPGELTFGILREHVSGVVTVTDDQLVRAMRFAFERMKLVIEPSGAAALAAVMFGALDVRGKRAGVIVSGGNIDAERFIQLLSSR